MPSSKRRVEEKNCNKALSFRLFRLCQKEIGFAGVLKTKGDLMGLSSVLFRNEPREET